MFTLSSPIGDFFLDRTALQYGCTQGRQKYNKYLQTYGQPGFRGPYILGSGLRYQNMMDGTREY